MDELVTYEEVGTVLDYSIPNLTVAIILLGAAIASLAIMLMLPSGSGANGEVKTLWRTSFMVVLLAALPLLAAGSFFGLGGTKVLFPKPSSTSNKILAESVWTVANRSISDKYGDFSFSDNSEIGNSDDSSYRWANPRSYKLEFTVDSGEISQTCRGTLSISEDSYPLDDLPDFDRLNPEDGESILKASKVTISSSCER